MLFQSEGQIVMFWVPAASRLSSVKMTARLVPKEGTFPHCNTVHLGGVQKFHLPSWKGHDGEIIQVLQCLGMGPSLWPLLSWLKGAGRNYTEKSSSLLIIFSPSVQLSGNSVMETNLVSLLFPKVSGCFSDLCLFLSPQECAPGYYRDTKGLFLGKCIPCHCNGHSDQCLPGSGICLVSKQ